MITRVGELAEAVAVDQDRGRLSVVRSVKWTSPRDDLPEQDAPGVDVGPGVDRARRRPLLGGRVFRRPHPGLEARQLRAARGRAGRVGALAIGTLARRQDLARDLHEPKVRDSERPPLREEAVGRLHVAVHQTARVREGQPVGGLEGQAQEGPPVGGVAPLCQPLLEGPAAHELDEDPRRALDLAHVIAASHVRVQPEVDPGLGLALKALEGDWVREQARERRLEREVHAPLGVADAIHSAHSTLAQERVHAVDPSQDLARLPARGVVRGHLLVEALGQAPAPGAPLEPLQAGQARDVRHARRAPRRGLVGQSPLGDRVRPTP